MEIREARSGAKAIYHQAASLSGLDVRPDSADRLGYLVDRGFDGVEESRRPEAVANLLRVVAFALESAQARGRGELHEGDEANGEQQVCPVYPFDML